MRRAAASLRRGAGFGLALLSSLAACSPTVEPTRTSLRAPAPLPPRSVAFVLVDMGGGVDLTPAAARGRLLDDADSLRRHTLASSFGAQDVTGEVFGPLRWAFAAGCDTNGLANGLRAQVPGAFDHYVWYMGTRQDVCGWKALATVGTRAAPSRDTWLDGVSSCLALTQEPQHNFGLQHASALVCPGAPLLADPNGCLVVEYGDPFDPMGGGCRHPNAWEKHYRGWLSGCNGVTVNDSGSFTLLPLERRCDGAQLLRIATTRPLSINRPAGGGGPAGVDVLTHYDVELRTPRDFDGDVGGAPLAPQVQIRLGAAIGPANQPGTHTYLLDMTPATPALEDAALAEGHTFVDPAGEVRITARAVSAESATIEVVLARDTFASQCLDGTTFQTPGRGPEACEDDVLPPIEPTTPVPDASAADGDPADVAAPDATVDLDAEATPEPPHDAPVEVAPADAAARAPVGPPFTGGCAFAGRAPVDGEIALLAVIACMGMLRSRRWPMRPRR